jgi:hypothetical protein
MKRLLGLALAVGMLAMLGGCVYDPAYYHRSGVVYDDGTATYSAPADAYYDDYYAPGYYYGSAYGPWYGGGWYPWVGVGFYGSYHHGYHGYHGHGGWHGGGNWHGSGGWHGHNGGGSHGGGHGGSHH